MASASVDGVFADKRRDAPVSYLQSLLELNSCYPAISGFLKRTEDSETRRIVREEYRKRHRALPGRCVLLTFHETHVEDRNFTTPSELAAYLDEHSFEEGKKPCHLWILEDLELSWVDILGARLGVDPLVFSEQTNTFNFTDSQTIVTRTLPSMVDAAKSFTLRYFEFRQLKDVDSIQTFTNQTTFAMNSRRIERWRDIDSPNFKCAWRHAFVRRCASFWTDQEPGVTGWNAIMLVDPAFDSFHWTNPHANLAPACTILQDPTTHARLDALWAARNKGHMIPTKDTSAAYHGGSHTFSVHTLSLARARSHPSVLNPGRNKSSPLDEMVLHWTQIADKDLILSAREHSVNSAHYLLKYMANLWVHTLDLVQSTIAQSEYFSQDYQATTDVKISSQEWRAKLTEVVDSIGDMHNLRRQMIHFEYQLGLNLERLGIVLGDEKVDPLEQIAIRDAQMDFLNLYHRLKPYVARAMALDKTANDLANFSNNFIGIQYSHFGLKLSIFASVLFPATLVSSMLSMGTDYLPGQPLFWVFWAVTIPVVLVIAAGMLFSQQIENWFKHRLRQKIC